MTTTDDNGEVLISGNVKLTGTLKVGDVACCTSRRRRLFAAKNKERKQVKMHNKLKVLNIKLVQETKKLEHDMKTLSALNHRWMMLSSVLFVAMVLSIFALGYYIAILMKFRNEMILQQQQEQQTIGKKLVKFIPI